VATLTIPVGTQPFTKTTERPESVQAGEALDVIVPVYKKAVDGKYYTANSVTTDPETYAVAGITFSKSEIDSQVSILKKKGTVVDFGVALVKGSAYFLVGTGIGLYSDITVGHRVVQIGYSDEATDLVIDIIDRGEVKT